jgi:hypothetical protein
VLLLFAGRVRVRVKAVNDEEKISRPNLLDSHRCRALEATYRPIVDSMLEAFQVLWASSSSV